MEYNVKKNLQPYIQQMAPYIMRPVSRGLDELVQHFPDNCIMAEIGSYAGESAEIFLKSGKIKKLYCIDPWVNGYDPNAIASSCEPMENIERLFDERLKNYNNVIKLKMKSIDAVILFPDNFFDVVYIDALHSYEGCRTDILIFLPKTSGIISGHDYDTKNWPGVVKAVNETLGTPDVIFKDCSWLFKKSYFELR